MDCKWAAMPTCGPLVTEMGVSCSDFADMVANKAVQILPTCDLSWHSEPIHAGILIVSAIRSFDLFLKFIGLDDHMIHAESDFQTNLLTSEVGTYSFVLLSANFSLLCIKQVHKKYTKGGVIQKKIKIPDILVDLTQSKIKEYWLKKKKVFCALPTSFCNPWSFRHSFLRNAPNEATRNPYSM